MKKVILNGNKRVKLIGRAPRRINDLERKHIRWNYEADFDSESGIYNFVLYGPGEEIGAGRFFLNVFGEYGNSGLDRDFDFPIQKHNRHFFYNAFRVFSNQTFSSLNFKEFEKYEIVQDKKLSSRENSKLIDYVESIYSKK